MSNISIFELEKKILKAQNPSEIDTITERIEAVLKEWQVLPEEK